MIHRLRDCIPDARLGLLARKGVVDLQDVLDAPSAQPLADWNTFQPIRTHIMQEAGKAFPTLADSQPGPLVA
jgi:hypothetical protein